MLDEVKPDGVIATLPNSQHLDLVRACARRKIHVWFQKPMSTSLRESLEMERLAQKAGIKLMIQWFRLWSPAVQELAARIQRGDLGPIQRLVWSDGYGAEHEQRMSHYYREYFWKPALQGGGALIEQGTYGLHWALWVMGRPSRVFAVARTLRNAPPYPSEDDAWITLEYPQGTAIVQGSWSMPDGVATPHPQFLVGTKGAARMEDGKLHLSLASAPTAAPHGDELKGPPVPHERSNGVAHFVDCIRNDRAVATAHAPALNVLLSEVTEAAYRSVRTGQPVKLPPRPSPRLSP